MANKHLKKIRPGLTFYIFQTSPATEEIAVSVKRKSSKRRHRKSVDDAVKLKHKGGKSECFIKEQVRPQTKLCLARLTTLGLDL